MRLRSELCGGLLLLSLSGGCNQRPPTYEVHGMVVFPDGKPLTSGTVEFEALHQKKPITASGEIAANGTFQLGTFEPNDGAIVGEHRVAVISDFEIGTGIERPDELPPERLHAKFRDFKSSGLKFIVKPQRNNILVEVDYAERPESDESKKAGD